MKRTMKSWLCLLLLFGVLFMITIRCEDNESSKTEETISDIDSNEYHIIAIGNQIWMMENLNVTHCNNGNPIQNVADNSKWNDLTTSAYCNYNNVSDNATIYGRLYNWYAVIDTCNLCPEGWHVPTETDWNILFDFLGGINVAGGKLKETGTTHWYSPNIGANNESGFNALPGGARGELGQFGFLNEGGFWWSSTDNYDSTAWLHGLGNGFKNVFNYNFNKEYGFSVRCIKD
jgi:uncharacterized protein (TIGR02145 family)